MPESIDATTPGDKAAAPTPESIDAATPGDKAAAPTPGDNAAAPTPGDNAAAAAAEATPAWRDDWREALAGNDEKLLGRLRRYASPENVAKSWAGMERQLSAGILKFTMPDNPSDEERAAFRKSWGIPDKPEGYDIKPPDTVAIDDDERQLMTAFVADMHAADMPKAYLEKAMAGYFKARAAQEQQMYDAANSLTLDQQVEIRTEFGRDYQRNVNLGNNDLVRILGPDRAKDLAQITIADGTKLGDNPNFVRYIVGAALRNADDDQLIVADTAKSGKSIDDQIKELGNLRFGNEDQRRQFHSAETQARYTKLFEAKARQQNRAA